MTSKMTPRLALEVSSFGTTMNSSSDHNQSPPINVPAQQPAEKHRSPLRRVIPWAVVIGAIGLYFSAGLIRPYLEAKKRFHEKNCLKEIAIALHNYHDAHQSFPPQFVADSTGRRLYSWRVLLLPHLGEAELFKRFHLNEPWDSVANLPLADKMPRVFGLEEEAGVINSDVRVMAVSGVNTTWPGKYASRLRDIRDGTSQTVMVISTIDSRTKWTEPFDVFWDLSKNWPAFEKSTALDFKFPVYQGSSYLQAAYADGSVQTITRNIDRRIFYGLFTCGKLWPPDFAGQAAELRERPAPKSRGGGNGPTNRVDVAYADNRASKLIEGKINIYAEPFEAIGLARDKAAKFLHGDPALASEFGQRDEPLAQTGIRVAKSVLRPFRERDRTENSGTIYDAGGHKDFPPELETCYRNAGPVPPDPGDVCIWCLFRFQSLFEKNFSVGDAPITFVDSQRRDRDTGWWGLDKWTGRDAGDPVGFQLSVRRHRSQNHFALAIVTLSGNSLVLACLPPKARISDALDELLSVGKKADDDSRARMIGGDELKVPMAAFRNENVAVNHSGGLAITSIRTVEFRLNESGAIFEGAGGEVLNQDAGDDLPPPGKRSFVFNGPFWIAMLDKDKSRVIYAIYLDDARALLDWKK